MSEVIWFILGILCSGVFRLVIGRIIIREAGAWKLEFRRFDEEDERYSQAWEDGYNASLKGQQHDK